MEKKLKKLKRLSKEELLQLLTDEEPYPAAEELKQELHRIRYRKKYRKLLRSTISILIVTAAIAAITATLILPVMQIYGSSMSPLLKEKDIVLSVKTQEIKRGDIISFYYSNRILVKRVVGLPMDIIQISDDGDVYVNGELLDEPYLKEKSIGECDIRFPYQVPEGSYFVMGDHRQTSIDSRTRAIGCILKEEIVGKIFFKVWPFDSFGPVR